MAGLSTEMPWLAEERCCRAVKDGRKKQTVYATEY
jgi:hypothetical protein